MKKRTGFVWHERYMWHDTGNYAGVMPSGGFVQPGLHVENPEAKRRFRNLLEVSGLYDELVKIAPRPADKADLLRVHTAEYVNKIEQLSAAGGGDAGFFTPFGAGSYEIACLSAGGVIAAMDAVLDGELDNAYALVRPPGHHAEPDMGKGFCLFCNAAVAAAYAREKRGLDRVAIVDWDVHHGNGAERIFWEDPAVLTISIHQDESFPPESGAMGQNGGGAGLGYNINIPLPAGCGVGAYEAVYDRVVVPALERFRPDLIIVPSGFDAGAHDPLGRMMMHGDGYRSLTRKLMAVADKVCGGRIVMCHEGGYDAPTVPFYGLAVMETLSGRRTSVEDPFLPIFASMKGQTLLPHQEAVIAEAEALLGRLS